VAEDTWQTIGTPSRIDAIFLNAALDGADAVAWAGGRTLQGRMQMPGRQAEVVFRATGPVQASAGSTVRLEVWSRSDRFHCEARVRAVDGTVLRLDRPHRIVRLDRRAAPRVQLDAGSALFRTAGATGCEILDVSATGVAFRCAADAPRPGARITGWLVLPGEEPMSVELVVQHTRADRGGNVAGAHLASMTARARVRLQGFVEARLPGAEAA
jgi:hypothetical protein